MYLARTYGVSVEEEVTNMKRMTTTFLILAALLLSNVAVAQAYTSVSLSFSYHDTLAPYGTWVNVASYGNCWRPYAAVRVGWRPYLYGHWVYTSYGPTWVGDEPWSWCAYHYGHWVFTDAFGWIWVPGYQWVPSDVVWSYGDGYVGWCPSYAVQRYGYSPFHASLWVFVGANNFTYGNYAGCTVQPTVVQNLFVRKTVQFNTAAPRREVLEHAARRPIPMQSVRQHEMTVDSRRVRMVVPQSEEAKVLKQASMTARKTGSSSTMKPMEQRSAVKKPAPAKAPQKLSPAASSKKPVAVATPKKLSPAATSKKPVAPPKKLSQPQPQHNTAPSKSTSRWDFAGTHKSTQQTTVASRPSQMTGQSRVAPTTHAKPSPSMSRMPATRSAPIAGGSHTMQQSSHVQKQTVSRSGVTSAAKRSQTAKGSAKSSKSSPHPHK